MLNIASDHLGLKGIDTLEQLAEIKRILVMGVTEPDEDEIVLEVSDLPEGASFNDAN